MRRARRLATMALVLGSVMAAASGCGGSGDDGSPTVAREQDDAVMMPYRRGVDTDVHRSVGALHDGVRTERIEYTSFDGQRVPAVFTVPADRSARGCLIYVPGFGQPKELSEDLRTGLANLRLATFTIDPRNVGARGGLEQALNAVKSPEGVRAMLVDTVADLRVALDYLTQRPECRSTFAVLGVSYGATVATHLAAQDHRIKAAVLSALGATYKQTVLMQPLAAKSIPNLPDYAYDASENPASLAHAVKVLSPYDPEKWIGKISPRPVMVINGRYDPLVTPGDALQVSDAARAPKTILYFKGGHDPFAPGPDHDLVTLKAAEFLVDSLDLPVPVL